MLGLAYQLQTSCTTVALIMHYWSVCDHSGFYVSVV